MQLSRERTSAEIPAPRAAWQPIAAGLLMALVALIVADWPHSVNFVSTKLCLAGEVDRRVFEMLVEERGKSILKNRYYGRRSSEAGELKLNYSRAYIDCLYDEAMQNTEIEEGKSIVSRSSFGRDLRASIEKIPFSSKAMSLNFNCDRRNGLAGARLQAGTSDAIELVSRNLVRPPEPEKAVIAAGVGSAKPACL